MVPSVLTTLGVVLFLRATLVIGIAGIGQTMVMLGIGLAVVSLTAISLSAVATSMKVQGGGAYFLLSRTFGASLGGGIGLGLFLAETIEISFYLLGLAEAFVLLFPALAPWRMQLSIVAYVGMFLVACLGAVRFLNAQSWVLSALGLSVVVILLGSFERFSWITFHSNFEALYRGSGAGITWSSDFWKMFAIYFPGLTGVLAGMGMSGDLENPGRSLTRGTFAAILVCGLVYLLQIVLCGGANDRMSLIAFPFQTLHSSAWQGLGFFVTFGVVITIISSAVSAILVAPRVLQAVARDRLLPSLEMFSAGSEGTDEPQPALAACGALVFVVLILANIVGKGDGLSLVAQTMSMVFLFTFGLINLAAFMQGISGNPSFRPRLRVFHWSLSLVGAVACLTLTFLIYWPAAVSALVLLTGLVLVVRRRAMKVAFGDVRRGFLFAAVREQLIQLQYYPEDQRNWRPTILVLSGSPDSRKVLLSFAEWFEAGCGVIYLARILVGNIERLVHERRRALHDLRQYCLDQRFSAFPMVAVAETLEQGLTSAIQLAGAGAVPPNLVLLGWPASCERVRERLVLLRQAVAHELTVVLVNVRGFSFPENPQRIDIWWRGHGNGELMLVLAYLATRTPDWRQATLFLRRQVARVGDRDFAMRELESLTEAASIDAILDVVVDERPFADVLVRASEDAGLVVLGMKLPDEEDEDAWITQNSTLIERLPNCVLVGTAPKRSIAGEK